MKILIIGIVASGKTTLAKRLSKENKINYYEIDSIVHDDIKNKKRTDEEQKKIINKINEQANWIIEGTLRKNLYYLLNMADKIIYLDIPLHIRKRRILFRYIKQKLKIEQCNYKPNIKMLKKMYKWTKEFEDTQNDFEKELLVYNKKAIKLKNKNQIKKFKL